MVRAGLMVLLLASCNPQTRPASHGHPGLKTKLIALEHDVAVGQPLRFRLELSNESAFAVVFNAQRVGREGSYDILRPDGTWAPFIDRPRQTTGADVLLRPGETVVLDEEYDIANDYLIALPGRYQVQFSGCGLTVIDAREVPLRAQYAAGTTDPNADPDRWFEEMDKESDKMYLSGIQVPSNTVTLDLKPGRPQERALFAERLLRILPQEWRLGVDNMAPEHETHILLQRLYVYKDETATVRVILTSGEAAGKRICTWGGRNVHADANAVAERLWPDFRAKVAEAMSP